MVTRRLISLVQLSTAATLCLGLAACVDPTVDDDVDYAGGSEDGIDVEEEDEGEVPPDLPEDEGETDGSNQEPPTCSSTTAFTEAVPPNVMLVVDKSRSMAYHTWDDDGDAGTEEVTRWYSLHGTVADIAGQYEDGMSLGLSLFPSMDAGWTLEDSCPVNATPEVATALDNADELLAAIPPAQSVEIYGATPAAAGVASALGHLESLQDGRPAAMILITDGAANCSLDSQDAGLFEDYDEDLPLIVADAWERAGIPTYVVGIDIEEASEYPFTNPREKLDEVAQLGGAPRAGEVGFYDALDAQSLNAALDEIAASVSCGVELGQAPSGPDELVISIDGQVVPRLDSCEQGDGWVYASADLTHIELCNAACDDLHSAGEVEAEFLCPPQP